MAIQDILARLMRPQHPRVRELLPLFVVPLPATLVPRVPNMVEVVLVGQVLDPCRQPVLSPGIVVEPEQSRERVLRQKSLGPRVVFGNVTVKLLPPLFLPLAEPVPSQKLTRKQIPPVGVCAQCSLPRPQQLGVFPRVLRDLFKEMG